MNQSCSNLRMSLWSSACIGDQTIFPVLQATIILKHANPRNSSSIMRSKHTVTRHARQGEDSSTTCLNPAAQTPAAHELHGTKFHARISLINCVSQAHHAAFHTPDPPRTRLSLPSTISTIRAPMKTRLSRFPLRRCWPAGIARARS